MGGDHGHGHGPGMKIPDYKIYKWEGIPELEAVNRALAQRGLKDPWMRNEAWQYSPEMRGTVKGNVQKLLLRGWKVGLALAIVSTALEKAWYAKYEKHHDHGHGHDAAASHKEECH